MLLEITVYYKNIKIRFILDLIIIVDIWNGNFEENKKDVKLWF